MISAAIVEGGVECDIHVLARFGRAVEGVGHAVDGAASFDFSGAAEGGDTAGFEVFGGGFMTVLPSFSWWRERGRVSHSMLQQHVAKSQRRTVLPALLVVVRAVALVHETRFLRAMEFFMSGCEGRGNGDK